MAEEPDPITTDNSKYKDGVNQNARLIVRNISFKATEDDLRKHFSSYGSVEEVKLLKKPDGRLVGCGFVHYTHVPMANEALAATNKKPFLGRPISVAWAVPKHKYGEPQSTNTIEKKTLPSASTDDEVSIKKEEEDVKITKEDKTRVNRKARLIIRNISFKATDESLKKHFEPYGELLEVKILKKPDGKLVGCAFVHYKNVPMAKKALEETNMKPFLGRPISVDWAVAKDKYMQHAVNKQLELQEQVKKEESDSDDDDGPSFNTSNDELKAEVKSESDEDVKSEDSDNESEKEESDASDDDDDKEEDDDDEGEDGSEEEDVDMDDQSEISSQVDRPRIKLNDAEDGCTVFVTNLPFSIDDDLLKEFAEKTGPVKYALVCVDKMTEHSKGSGFVKFVNKEDADRFLAAPADQLRLDGQSVHVKPALKRENLQKGNQKESKDNRNLYLVKEGVVVAGTKAALGLSQSDMAKRLALERSKTQMLKNLNRFVSKYRLVVSNLTPNYDDAKLRKLVMAAVGNKSTVTECRVMRDLRAPIGKDGKYPDAEPSASPAGTPSPQSSTSSLQEELRRVRTKRAQDAVKIKSKTKSSARKQLQFATANKEEVGRLLLPDAPPRKRKITNSPERVDCPLVAGTPPTPPKIKVPPWIKTREVPEASMSVEHDPLCVDMREDREKVRPDSVISGAEALIQLVTSKPYNESAVGLLATCEPNDDSAFAQLDTSEPDNNSAFAQMDTSESKNDSELVKLDSASNDSALAQMDCEQNNDSSFAHLDTSDSDNDSAFVQKIDTSEQNNDSSFSQLDTSEPDNYSAFVQKIDTSEQNNDSAFVQLDTTEPNSDSELSQLDTFGPDNDSAFVQKMETSDQNNDSAFAQLDTSEPDNDSAFVQKIDTSERNNDSAFSQLDTSEPDNDSAFVQKIDTSKRNNDSAFVQLDTTETNNDSVLSQLDTSKTKVDSTAGVVENVQIELIDLFSTSKQNVDDDLSIISTDGQDMADNDITQSLDDSCEMQIFFDDPPNPNSDEEIEPEQNECTGASDFPIDLPESINPEDRNRILEMERQDDSYLQSTADADKVRFQWQCNPDTFKGKREKFTASAGPTFKVKATMSPLDIMKKIWDETIINLIVKQTNIYAQQILKKQVKTQSRMKLWKPITSEDIWQYFAVLILQSLDPRPSESEYWYTRLPYLQMPAFKSVMQYKKYILIKKCLHFVNNQHISKTDKLAKIKPIVDHLNKKFSNLYIPSQEIALDESLLKWQGKLGFSQKIANKVAKVGIKTYEIAETATGYLWTFRVYAGKNSSSQQDKRTDESDGKISAIVFDLLRPLLNKGYTLTMDNFYNSPLLSRILKTQKTDTLGTLRINRQFVPEVIKKCAKNDIRVGEVVFSYTNDLSVLLWRDSNLVAMISTYHKVEIGGQEKHGKYKYKPQAVLDYNKYMGGVDKKDQLLSAFPMERVRNHTWYKKLFRHLFNSSIVNAWIILKMVKPKLSHRDFRTILVENIMGKNVPVEMPSEIKVINSMPKGFRPKLEGGHYCVKGESGRARCRLCAQSGRDSRTLRRCDVCEIPLCAEPCFKNWHTQF